MKKSMLLLLCFTVVYTNWAQDESSEEILSVHTFSQENYRTKNMTAKQTSEGLEITVNSGEKGVISFSSKDLYWDLRQWVYLSLDLENMMAQEVRFEPIILYDSPKRQKNFKKSKHKHIGFLKPSENLIYNCVLFRDQITTSDYPQKEDFPGMRGLPNGVIIQWAGVDAKHIKGLQIVFPAQNFERKVLVKRILKKHSALPEIYQENKEAFFPFINKYGQYKHSSWEGKITDDSQFATAIEKEEKDLLAHKGSNEWNRFGGFAAGPKMKATGHFRTQKIAGKWWIIDPDGNLFWSTGVNGAGKLSVGTPLKGRKHFFKGLPKKNSETEKFYKGEHTYLYGSANLYKKYGAGAEEKYLPISLKRMKSWGLNTLGGWSNEAISQQPENIKLPYTVFITALYPTINEKFPDVFDPRWKANVEKSIKEKAVLVKNDPYFFGFFINNEIHWGTPFSLANNALAKDGKSAGKKAYLTVLQERLGSITEFNELTGGSFKSWKELLNTKVSKGKLNVFALKDVNIEHYKKMCEVYFKTTKELINKHAPGKMYLGCRWHGNHKNSYNMAIAAKYVDILTFNAYENEIEFYPYPPKSVDKPFIVSEFNFGALDRGKFFTGLGYASDQRNRGEKYVNFIQGALRNPKCVGAHWFMWANSTTAGRGNGENASCGLVSMTDQIYDELISYMREINYQLYNYSMENSN